jgi:hypothetical protein
MAKIVTEPKKQFSFKTIEETADELNHTLDLIYEAVNMISTASLGLSLIKDTECTGYGPATSLLPDHHVKLLKMLDLSKECWQELIRIMDFFNLESNPDNFIKAIEEQ